MNKALVFGATGSIGAELVLELLRSGIHTVAFARSDKKLADLQAEWEAISKDGSKQSSNVEPGHPTLMNNVVTAAKYHQAKVVVIDNIYAYGKAKTQLVNELHPKEPHTTKGKIRLEMEQLVWKAHEEGTPCMLVHLPDFYGPHAHNTFLHVTLQAMAKGKPSMFIGDPNIQREYIYTPDAAQAVVQLAKRPHTFGTT